MVRFSGGVSDTLHAAQRLPRTRRAPQRPGAPGPPPPCSSLPGPWGRGVSGPPLLELSGAGSRQAGAAPLLGEGHVPSFGTRSGRRDSGQTCDVLAVPSASWRSGGLTFAWPTLTRNPSGRGLLLLTVQGGRPLEARACGTRSWSRTQAGSRACTSTGPPVAAERRELLVLLCLHVLAGCWEGLELAARTDRRQLVVPERQRRRLQRLLQGSHRLTSSWASASSRMSLAQSGERSAEASAAGLGGRLPSLRTFHVRRGA